MKSNTTEREFRKLLDNAGVTINGSQPWDIQIHNRRVYKAVLYDGSLGLGESYMNGWWDAEEIDQLIARILRADLSKSIKYNFSTIFRYLLHYVFNMQSRKRAYRSVTHHYDKGIRLYSAFLDPYMQYSCAFFEGTNSLNKAQEQKLELICKKLQLKSSDTLLDIGCGWGGLAKYAAENYGCHVTGITLSPSQCEYARKLCQGLPVDIKQMDYRDLAHKYDKVVSVGMFEHVGWKNYRIFLQIARKSLKRNGLFLLHTIGANTSSYYTDQWLAKYIFPNSLVPSAKQITNASEGLFVIEDWHNFGVFYARTLRAWMQNFDRNWDRIKSAYDEKFYRMWKYYLLSCAGSFDARHNQLWQIVLTQNGLPEGYYSIHHLDKPAVRAAHTLAIHESVNS